MASARMMRLSRVVRDLNALTVGYSAAANEHNILRNDLMNLAQGGMRPASTSVQQLSRNLISYLPQRSTALLNTERLALNLETVMNGARLNASQINRAVNSSQSLLRSSGLPQAGQQAVASSMRNVGFAGLAGNPAAFMR